MLGDTRQPEHVPGLGDVDGPDGELEVPRLLVTERVHHPAAHLEQPRRRHLVQVTGSDDQIHRLATSLHNHVERNRHVVVECSLEGDKVSDECTADRHQHVTNLQGPLTRSPRGCILHHQRASPVVATLRLPQRSLRVHTQPEPVRVKQDVILIAAPFGNKSKKRTCGTRRSLCT